MSSIQAIPGSMPIPAHPTATSASAATMISKLQTTTSAALPPLTTPWSNPLSCTWTYVLGRPNETAAHDAVAFLDLAPIPGDKTLSCYPDGMFSYGRTGVFSPGTCPGGWTTASVLTNAGPVQETTTTTAICCSYGYTLSGSACKRSVATALAVPITYDTTVGTYTVLTQSTTTLYSALLAVSTIQVLFGDDDKRQLGISSLTHHSGQPMSLGTRIGIAAAIGAFILLCLGLMYLVIIRRRRSREGLTKKRLMQDLKSMHRREPSGNEQFHSHIRSMSANEPPPSYHVGRIRSNLPSGDAELGTLRASEIRILHQQKAVIQQRLNELEDSEDSRCECSASR